MKKFLLFLFRPYIIAFENIKRNEQLLRQLSVKKTEYVLIKTPDINDPLITGELSAIYLSYTFQGFMASLERDVLAKFKDGAPSETIRGTLIALNDLRERLADINAIHQLRVSTNEQKA